MSDNAEHRRRTEAAVLGMIIRGHDGVLEAALEMGVDASWFWRPFHGLVWEAIYAAERAGRTPDLAEIGVKVSASDEGAAGVVSLCDDAPIAQNANAWLTELRALKWRQHAISELETLRNALWTRDPFQHDDFELVADTMARLSRGKEFEDASDRPVPEIAEELVTTLEERVTARFDGTPRGVPTGFKGLDVALGGWVAGRLYVVAARPSVGKTTLAVNFASAAADAEMPWLYCTLEMDSPDIVEKLLSLRSRVVGSKLQSGDLSTDDLDRACHGLRQIQEISGYVDNRSGRYIETFEVAVKRAKRNRGVRVVFLDYLQQMRVRRGRHANRQAELTEITDRVKRLALETGVAIVAAAQLSREAEKTNAPLMSHLKESGSIEQDADAVLFIQRDKDDPHASTWLVIGKNRQGRRGKVLANVDFAVNRFGEASHNQEGHLE